MRLRGIHVIYRRVRTGLVIVRDRIGNRIYLETNPFRIRRKDSAGFVWYGRIDFRSRRRFTRYIRSQQTLEAALARLPDGQIIDSGLVNLPYERTRTRRTPNQGMTEAIDRIRLVYDYDSPTSDATSYAAWVLGRQTVRHEWCHLVAHSMGGRDRPANVVAAAVGTNSEQLAIENILSAYRNENLFRLQVLAGLYNRDAGQHLATVFRYSIASRASHTTLDIFLDATVDAIQPSAIHQYALVRVVGTWLNKEIERCETFITAEEKKAVRKYLKSQRYDVGEDDDGV